MVEFMLNGQPFTFDGESDTPLLWVVREDAELTGSKFGCGKALCGACTMYVNARPIRACVLPVAAVAGQQVTTIEGLQGAVFEAVVAAWQAHNVPQCGYCQSGQVMAAVHLLANNPQPDAEAITEAMNGHLCRCGTYPRIRAAIETAAKQLQAEKTL